MQIFSAHSVCVALKRLTEWWGQGKLRAGLVGTWKVSRKWKVRKVGFFCHLHMSRVHKFSLSISLFLGLTNFTFIISSTFHLHPFTFYFSTFFSYNQTNIVWTSWNIRDSREILDLNQVLGVEAQSKYCHKCVRYSKVFCNSTVSSCFLGFMLP